MTAAADFGASSSSSLTSAGAVAVSTIPARRRTGNHRYVQKTCGTYSVRRSNLASADPRRSKHRRNSRHLRQSRTTHCYIPRGVTSADHVYERIDDESATSSSEYHRLSGSSSNRQTADSCYGEHSDWSQHSSSSYAYDQRPLLRSKNAVTFGRHRDRRCSDEVRHSSSSAVVEFVRSRTLQQQASRLGRNAARGSPRSNKHPECIPDRSNRSGVAEEALERVLLRTTYPQVEVERDSGSWSPVTPDLAQYPTDDALLAMTALEGGRNLVVLSDSVDLHKSPPSSDIDDDQNPSTYC